MISVIMPTYGRPEQAVNTVYNFMDVSPLDKAELICIVDNDDWISHKALAQNSDFPAYPYEFHREHLGPVAGWNLGVTRASGDIFVLAADDIYFPPGWLDTALDWYKPGHLLSLSDGIGRPLATHYMVDRQAITEILGGVLAVPHYFSQYLDVEATRRAEKMERIIFPNEQIIEHRHPAFGRAPKDDTYRIGDKWMLKDQAVYQARQKAGFPNDYDPII